MLNTQFQPVKEIKTPMGLAHLFAWGPEHKSVCVEFRKTDYTPEQWLGISPGNGPTVYKTYDLSEISRMPDAEGK